MSRFAQERRVIFWEEPIFDRDLDTSPYLEIAKCAASGVTIVTPHLADSQRGCVNSLLEALLAEYARSNDIKDPIAWFYTPMALEFFPSSINPSLVIYDCMDELSLFRGAPPELVERERQLMNIAGLVFTGGASLYEAKRVRHPNVYAFPSGVDAEHFRQARGLDREFAEQAALPHPRLGYAGVIDERIDIDLVDTIARTHPEWQVVMLGPTAKIDPASLPQHPNLHWLGMKAYADLPGYFAGWDLAIMPFAINDATRFISPTKTPEFLSAGLPVVSTAIRDVVRPYGERGLVRIGETPDQFLEACEQAIAKPASQAWWNQTDDFLRALSWDATWSGMRRLIEPGTAQRKDALTVPASNREATARV